jgi:hypothetical protein
LFSSTVSLRIVSHWCVFEKKELTETKKGKADSNEVKDLRNMIVVVEYASATTDPRRFFFIQVKIEMENKRKEKERKKKSKYL